MYMHGAFQLRWLVEANEGTVKYSFVKKEKQLENECYFKRVYTEANYKGKR